MTIDLRRTTSGTFTVMALALVLLAACETNENRMDATELTVFATRYAAAWSGQDPAAFALFYAESGSFAINDGEPAVGRDAIEEVAQGFMNAFPDMLVTLVEVRQQKGQVFFYWHWTGTNTGSGGSGNAVDLKGHEEWIIDSDGLILKSLGHLDDAEYQRQLNADTSSH